MSSNGINQPMGLYDHQIQALKMQQQVLLERQLKLSKISWICFITFYIAGLVLGFLLVNEEVPDPYMDEVFHVDQARSYCVGNFTRVSTSL